MKKLIYRLFLFTGFILTSFGFANATTDIGTTLSNVESEQIKELKDTKTDNLYFSDIIDQQLDGVLVSRHYSHSSHSSHSSHHSHYSSR